MIDVITQSNRKAFEHILHEMFAMRYRVAKQQWGWDLPDADNGIDIDAFDTPSTIYFVKRNDLGSVIACVRINPTTRPHMMTEVFSDVCDQRPIPIGPEVWELSRFIVDKKQVSNRDFVATSFAVLAAMTEFCHAVGIRQLSWYAFQLTYASSLQVWRSYPLGTPRTHPNDEAVYIPALSIVDEQAVSKTKAKARIDGPSCRYLLPDLVREAPLSAAAQWVKVA